MASNYGVITKEVFSSLNTYIAPYSSAKDGGELVSEFNLRAALNAAAAKEVKIKLEGMELTIHSGFTGCGKANSVGASIDRSGKLAIASGQCVIKGYFVHLMETITMRTSELISAGELTDRGYPKKLILLRVNTTSSSQTNPHDERLRPPSGSNYPCVDIVITPPEVGNGLRNYEVFENEILLGVLSRTPSDNFKVTPNPFKDGVFSSGQILWDKESTPWIQPPGDSNIPSYEFGIPVYGVTNATPTATDGLVEITDRLWLGYNSVLGTYLRGLVVNPEDSTSGSTKPLGLLVGYQQANPSFPPDGQFNATKKLWTTRKTKNSFDVAFRVMQGGVKGENPYAFDKLTIPTATYNDRKMPDLQPAVTGTAGLIDPDSLRRLDILYASLEDPNKKGTEYGPFFDRIEYEQFRKDCGIGDYDPDSKAPMFRPGDFFWILNDEVEVDGEKLNTSFGSVRGNAETTVFGKADTSTASLTLSFEQDYDIPIPITGEGTVKSTKPVAFDADVVGADIELSFSGAEFTGDSTVMFNSSVPIDSFGANGTDITITMQDPSDPSQEITVTGTAAGTWVTDPGTTPYSVQATSATGTLAGTIGSAQVAKSQKLHINGGTLETDVDLTASNPITGKLELKDKSFAVSGKLSQLNLQAAGNVSFTGEMTSFTQNVSVRYVYTRLWEITTEITTEPDPADRSKTITKTVKKFVWKDEYGFMKQAVLRGFATPATYQYYGFVRPGSGNNIGDVIMDETNHLALSPATLARLKSVGWVYDESQEISLTPASVNAYTGHWFTNPVTIKLVGSGWSEDIVLSKIRGDITLDISGAEFNESEDDTRPVLLTCDDVSTINLKVLTDQNVLTKGMINVKGCVLTKSNFNSIYEWIDSRFDSGSNTISLDNPWVNIPNPFNLDFDHRVQTRFVSVTRGRYGVEDAVLDVWVKVEDSDNLINWTDPLILQSRASYLLPPLSVVYNETGSSVSQDTQYIPTSLNAVVTGTGGLYKAWEGDELKLSGSFVSTIEWADNGPISVVGRLTNPDDSRMHGIYDMRFRAHVQFTNVESSLDTVISYDAVRGLNPRSS